MRHELSGSRWLIATILMALALVAPGREVAAEDWPQFRGLNASGVSTSEKAPPVHFSADQNVAWSAHLGDGIGSPIVCGGRVFATALVEGTRFAIVALDAATGELLWRREYETGKLPRITPPNSHASSTPACDGKRVYAYFSTLGIVALNVADGAEAWKAPLPVPAYLMDWGAGASPIVYRDLVVFNQDDDLAPTLYAFDAATGRLRWKTERPEMLAGYSIPVICEAGGQTDIVIAGTGRLIGYNPDDGRERWTCNTLVRTLMTSPVVRDGVIYVSVQSYGDEKRTLKFALLEWLDTDQDGRLTRAEVPREFHERFDRSDKDHDGVLAEGELDTGFQSPENMVGGGSIIQAIRGGGSGDVTKTHVVWNLQKTKAPSNLASPLLVGEQLFVVKRGGLSSSFDAATGAKQWELSRINSLGDYYASPVAAGGHIYVTGETGFVVVLAQGAKLNVVARNDLGESCLATPAIADGRLYFRTREKLMCFESQSP